MKIFDFLFKRMTKVTADSRSKKKVTLDMVVTRADGSVERYMADEKGQRRIK